MSTHDPDWSGILGLQSRAQAGNASAKVGDPIRWGGQAAFVFTSVAFPRPLSTSDQILRAQVADTYARTWSLTGAVYASPAMWARPANEWLLFLEVMSGAGQQVITQFFDLRTLTTIGLAGGYAPDITDFSGATEGRSYAAIGAVVGQQVAVRLRGLPIAAGIAGEPVRASVLCAPLAAGQGL